MKLIEALKGQKDMLRKVEDLQGKIAKHSAYLSHETPVYEDQPKQVEKWIQMRNDLLKELLRLRIAVQRTNLDTMVDIELEGKAVTKSIAAWIHRRRDLASLERGSYATLTDRNLKGGFIQDSQQQQKEVKIIRCYSPEKRDEKIDALSSEPITIDSKLEIVNAVTDLIE